MKKAWIGESWFKLRPEKKSDNKDGRPTDDDNKMKGYEPSEVEESKGKSLC